MKEVTIKNLTIGNGSPKICVPLCGKNKEELLGQIKEYENDVVDLIEWRVDFFEDATDAEKVIDLAAALQKSVPKKPILFTFRTKQEGGEQAISKEDYLALNLAVAKSGYVDMIDLELFITEGKEELSDVIREIHKYPVKIIASNHDFEKTPSKESIVSRLQQMQDMGADIAKIAVMPNSSDDVLTLLSATNTMKEEYANIPIVTMSMGKLGVISRICGECFGSAITFGSLTKASAPGQIPVQELKNMLNLLSGSSIDSIK